MKVVVCNIKEEEYDSWSAPSRDHVFKVLMISDKYMCRFNCSREDLQVGIKKGLGLYTAT